MRKFIKYLLLLLILSISLAGCADKSKDADNKSNQLSDEEKEKAIEEFFDKLLGNEDTAEVNNVQNRPTSIPNEENPDNNAVSEDDIIESATDIIEDTPEDEVDNAADKPKATEDDPNVKAINVWSFTDEVPNIIRIFKEQHPDFPYEINVTIISTTDGFYQPSLEQALLAGGADAPDIFATESLFVYNYSQGNLYSYSAPYVDLGINVEERLVEAEIAPYIAEVGTNPVGDLVALGYQSTAGAFIYRRSIARDVWGTDDPDVIKNKIGPGMNKFTEAAAEVNRKGYSIVSGIDDLWHIVEGGSNKGWVVDGKLHIDPDRQGFLDISKQFINKAYCNNTKAWYDTWYEDMEGDGIQPVLGFFGPVWLINYVMSVNSGGERIGEGTYGDWAVCEPPMGFFWGGTWLHANKDTKVPKAVGEIIEWITLDASMSGFQYQLANGYIYESKDTVASGAVMKISNGEMDFLSGQNIFDIFINANSMVKGHNKTQYDDAIYNIWREQVIDYAYGNKDKEGAIAGLKQYIADDYDLLVE